MSTARFIASRFVEDAAENRAVAANENMEKWNSIFSTEPRFPQSRSQLLSTIEKSQI